ncbi:ComEC/Rec2 family competence protein [Agrococcus sp. ARC_14]|uniref:ComEC/Rec2 family competence protein n=1 Tax=Agrococcus sp. ARC_14 TaxID=2919927 RepID=UPI001F064A02|nr:ComEC/Rec2 family competence protein [Agrococcus sp. ARC_14]MCH1882938.1 ComEC/Rec2 family competence protein [Agrococcus sp. ARC_14]
MRDLRLALPVAIAWAVLAALSGNGAVLGVAAALAAGIAAACLLGAHLWSRRLSPWLAGGRSAAWDGVAVLRTLALGAALACPLLLGADAVVATGLEECDELSLLLLGQAAPTEVVVTGCDGASLGGGMLRSALLLRVSDAALTIGGTATGPCDAWLDGSRWLLTCSELEVAEPAAWSAWAGPLRDGLLQASAQLPGVGGELLPGLSIGDERRVSPQLRTAMLDTGLSHLTAVSGANCVIVVGAAFLAAAALGARRSVRVAVALGALAAFVVLVTPEPSVVRAGAMASIGLLGIATGRRAGAVALLSLAVLVVLAMQPHLATSAGFALSALATCGLIVHGRAIANVLSRWLPMPIAALIAVPLAAQLWCMPVLVALDARVSLVSVLANLLAGPAAPIVTVVGLAACLAAPLAPAVAVGLAWVAWLPAAWIAQVAMLAQQLPAAQTPWPVAPWGVVAASVMLALVVVGHARRLLARGVAGALVLGLVVGLGAAWPSIRLGSLADWRVAQCDVGQGSATLVRHGGAVLLVDTGEDPALVQRCLSMLGVQGVDLLVLTHFDVDHSGGSPALVGRTGLLVHGPLDERAVPVVEELAAGGAATQQASRGDAWQVGEVRVEALWPVGEVEPGNDASVAVSIDLPGGGLELVVLGDLGAESQSRLLRAGLPSAAVVVVAHHGSADQLPALYHRIAASAGLIGVGENDYGHPTDAAMRLVQESGGVPLRTDELGTIALAVDEAGVRVWTERVGGSGATEPVGSGP